ncbi:protein argonaute 2 [Rhizoctonia solani]|uniref:Protein argonaute 2 n=1 Tax=Rhizoctonia solani TaxID=456999 RepID=A0A8H8P835_9AGAM|nr:protein argonaute 2 [Rhizoctonia solani]QRW25262.1 protein argonaute 2 [Rhizoctonia solani]
MPPQQRGQSRGRGTPPGGDRGRGSGYRGRGGDRGGGDRGRGSDRGGRGGDQNTQSHSRGRGGPRGRGGSGFAPRYEAAVVPEYHPDPEEATGVDAPTIADGVTTVGVRRPTARGTAGRQLTVTTNNFKITLPEVTLHHYDDIKTDVPKPVKWNLDVIRTLQEQVAPTIFTPRTVYDGRKNLFASRCLPLSSRDGKIQTFDVSMEPARPGGRPPRVYQVTLKHVATINPVLLQRYQEGRQSISKEVLTAFTAVNVVVRMDPILRYPFNARSFFTNKEVRPIGGGIELWRGYFQSVRPGMASMLINIDISTGAMHSPGPMIGGLSDRDRLKLERLLVGVRFVTTHRERSGQVSNRPKVIRRITSQGADTLLFTNSEGNEITVAHYFQTLGINLSFPRYTCVETGSGAAYPIELCSIIPGQLMKRQIPPELISSMLAFSTKKPKERLNSIVAGHSVLQYGQSEYMRQFGMAVSQHPEKALARVIPPPALNYGPNSKSRQIHPKDGSWNVRDQKFFKGAQCTGWALVIYDTRSIRQGDAQDIVKGLKEQADLLGIQQISNDPPIVFPSAQYLDVGQQLRLAGQQVYQKTKAPPSLIVIVLPESSAELYQAVKQYSSKALEMLLKAWQPNASGQINAGVLSLNIGQMINAKLGGVNNVLDPNAPNLRFLVDAANPPIILGADVMHPAPGPGAKERPSFAALVGSIDSTVAHYTAVSQVQQSGLEIIHNLENMVYETHASAIIDPTITVVVVGKRHHQLFFPTHGSEDKSGNCPAGTVVDDVVGHPTEFDFYLQSHGGLLGTSRSSHYSVLHENHFTVDGIQAVSYALCHVYARATRSVSIPAPVYYADIVCARAKNHYDPSFGYASINDTGTEASGETGAAVQRFQDNFKQAHNGQRYKMYFQ